MAAQRGAIMEPAPAAEMQRHLERLAATAVAAAALDLVRSGFDDARADGPHLAVRHGRLRYAVCSEIRHLDGNRARVQRLVAEAIARDGVTTAPSRPAR